LRSKNIGNDNGIRKGGERRPNTARFLGISRVEDEPWYREWREALDRVIRAQMARDAARPGTPQREAADLEYDAAFAVFSALAKQVQ